MDYFFLQRISEHDIDTIVELAGGTRVVEDDSRETELNADYQLQEAIIELKLFEEEGLEKSERRRKIADLFRDHQPNRPTVILDSSLLSESGRRKYRRAMSGPIKTHIKKAAKQLRATAAKLRTCQSKIFLAINNNYASLSHEEFSNLIVDRARNDTSQIDYVISGGVYWHSDGFDNYFLAPFELFEVCAEASFNGFEGLRNAWVEHIEERMTEMILRTEPIHPDKRPIMDLHYELDGIRFIKPAPRIGEPSGFYLNGTRPRCNTSGIETCPAVATVLPRLDKNDWGLFREAMPREEFLRSNFGEWLGWTHQEADAENDPLRPAVLIDVGFEEFREWSSEPIDLSDYHQICEFATVKFNRLIRHIMSTAISADESKLVHTRYMHVVTEEIGQDEANDVSSIHYVSELPGLEKQEVVLKDTRMFREYAIALAAAYGIKHGAEFVTYSRDSTYAWI